MPHGLEKGSSWPIVNRVGVLSEQFPPVCIYTLLGGSLLLKKPEGSGNNRPFSKQRLVSCPDPRHNPHYFCHLSK